MTCAAVTSARPAVDLRGSVRPGPSWQYARRPGVVCWVGRDDSGFDHFGGYVSVGEEVVDGVDRVLGECEDQEAACTGDSDVEGA